RTEAAEELAAQQERAQHQIAESLVFADQSAQGIRLHLEDLSGRPYDRRVESGLPGQQTELAEEAARAVDRDRGLGALGVGVRRYQPLEDHEEVVRGVARAVEAIPYGRRR